MPAATLVKESEYGKFIVSRTEEYGGVIIQTGLTEWNKERIGELGELLANVKGNYILDATNNTWMSLEMLKFIIHSFRQARKEDRIPKLVTGNPYLEGLLEMSGTKSTLTPYATLEDALTH